MVEKDLLQTVAIDLGIKRYSVESEAQFNNRVIYSAMACWIKATCQDLPVGGERSEGVSRRHIHDKCSRILSAFLCRYHSSEPWFAVEEANNDAVGILRSRLLRHQELINVGYNTNVASAATSNVCLSDGLEVIRGMLLLTGAMYNGIALTKQPALPEVSSKLDVSPVGEWFDSYVKTAWWEPFDASKEDSLEYFNAKLLFIIDEAHMYRGSSGGEVALLVRRVLHKLGIGRERVQFILTSASIPSDPEKQKDVYQFACDLSAQNIENHVFKLITGKQEPVEMNGRDFDPNILLDFDIDLLQQGWPEKVEAIKDFATRVGFDLSCDFTDEKSVENWLYNELKNCNPMLHIMKMTRGRATSFKKLAAEVFSTTEQEVAEKAVSVLLAIAPLAKNNAGSVLYPARLHMMFRGLQGIYACSNPHCTCNNHDTDSLGTGRVYLNRAGTRCECGGMIYELINERSCGALFLKGYVDEAEMPTPFVWNATGEQFSKTLKEVHFYIIPDDGTYERSGNEKVAWLNTVSGRLDVYNDHTGETGYLHVAFCSSEIKGRPDIWTFKTCPKCDKQHFEATDFVTKGNEPFFNLVSEQFYIQPPVPKFKGKDNEGRKVLLFSDSRQRAAILARDLTRAADEDAMKKALTEVPPVK